MVAHEQKIAVQRQPQQEASDPIGLLQEQNRSRHSRNGAAAADALSQCPSTLDQMMQRYKSNVMPAYG